MADLAGPIFTALSGDGTLTGLIGTYGGDPAIFTSNKVPFDAPLPRIWSPANVATSNFDTLSTDGQDIFRDIMCYVKGAGESGVDNDDALLEQIADRIKTVMHHNLLTITGYNNVITIATPPIVAPTDDTIDGRVISCRFIIQET